MQEDEHHKDDQCDGFEECLGDFLDRKLDEVRAVSREGNLVTVGQVDCELRDFCLDQFGGLQRVGAGRQLKRDTGGRVAIKAGRGVVAVASQFDARNIAETDE